MQLAVGVQDGANTRARSRSEHRTMRGKHRIQKGTGESRPGSGAKDGATTGRGDLLR